MSDQSKVSTFMSPGNVSSDMYNTMPMSGSYESSNPAFLTVFNGGGGGPENSYLTHSNGSLFTQSSSQASFDSCPDSSAHHTHAASSESSAAVTTAAKVAAVAAVAANQYLSASLNAVSSVAAAAAAAAAATNHHYHHRYPHYHFELGSVNNNKQSSPNNTPIECRRSGGNGHYSHLTYTGKYYGHKRIGDVYSMFYFNYFKRI